MLTYIVTLLQITLVIIAGLIAYDFLNFMLQFDKGDSNE